MKQAGWLLVLSPLLLGTRPASADEVKVGSKAFTESVILGELVTQVAQGQGIPIRHRRELGGTAILWQGLQSKEVDVYADYLGTISRELLAEQNLRGEEAIRQALAQRGIAMSRPLGFNDTYELGMKEELAERLNIQTISDLRRHPDLTFGFTNEIMSRADGWPGLREHYQLPQKDVRGLEHALSYQALDRGAIQVTDFYSTDPEKRYHRLRVLKDDRHFFPSYAAVLLYRQDLQTRAPKVVEAFLQLEGRIPLAAILEMNARAQPKEGERVPEDRVAAEFLAENPFFHAADDDRENLAPASQESLAEKLLVLTREHLLLVVVSLAGAVLIAVPLGVAAARWPGAGQVILGGVGLIQTIPTLALLVFLIPVCGLGYKPAVLALFLYSLLPIVRNTYAGLHDLTLQVRESARALGLPPAARLRLVELPLASRSILAGVKTAAVINVGTATLGGLIGAGGYGELIFTGLRLANNRIILEGAIPAALLALAVQGLFELAERFLVPRGLRLRPEG
jgi:osmoprotectant transport system permease protein